MSHIKLERNKALVKLRKRYLKDLAEGKKPKKTWSWKALSEEFGFKSRATAKEIYDNFIHRV